MKRVLRVELNYEKEFVDLCTTSGWDLGFGELSGKDTSN